MTRGSTLTYARFQRLARDHPVAVDAVAALVLACVCFSGTALSAPGAPAPSRLAGLLPILLICAALLGQRRFPRAYAVLAIACAITLAAQGYVLTPLVLAPAMVALFLLGLRADRRAAYLLTLAAIAGVTCAALLVDSVAEPIGLKVLGPQAWLLIPTLLGAAAHGRAQYQGRMRDEEARMGIAEERMRIARDLHDVVAHHLALANARAGTVAHLIAADPGQAHQMAVELADTIASALRELKGTVGLLRAGADTGPEAPLEPAPGLAQLGGLVDSFGSAGLMVATTTSGAPRPLSPAVDVTAFRVVQEALTNVAKHARVSRADVRLAFEDRRLTITISNRAGHRPTAGSAAVLSPTASGYGLIGMRERAASVGGRLLAGRRFDGGFEVTAELPLQPPVRPEEPVR
ncbi:MAG TPA: histidine kinase [Trebonia sp.]